MGGAPHGGASVLMGGGWKKIVGWGGGGGGGGLSQHIGGAWGGLKMLLKNTCEGVHLSVKLPAISLQIY